MTKKIVIRPKCFTGEQSVAYTNRGHLIPCCYCDSHRTMDDPRFQKLLEQSKVSEHETIEDIIMQPEWLKFEENLRLQKIDDLPWACINTCKVREDSEDVVRKETYYTPDKPKGEKALVRKI